MIALLIGPRVISKLHERQIGQTIREEGVQEHKKKAGIPTMGGAIILLSMLIASAFWGKWNGFVIIAIISTIGMGFIGMLDDLTKVIKARSLGLTPRQKLLGQALVGLLVALPLRYLPEMQMGITFPQDFGQETRVLSSSVIQLPFFGTHDLGMLYVPFVVFVMLCTSNAVNLTDGLDGLASGCTAMSIIPFLLFSYICGHQVFARHLGVLYIPGVGELAVVCGALFGACLGFLWYNSHPAEVFMGDTGSLAMGGTIGAIAAATRTEFFLVIVGGVFVAEAVSVIMQVSYFKWTHGKRIFRMTPIHHHFELAGWAEEKVVIRFWVIGLFLALTGLACFASGLVWR